MTNLFRLKKAEEYGEKYGTQPDWNAWRKSNSFDARHGIISLDLSQIELVLIGEFSQDPEFRKAYGQLPYRDLHEVAGAAVLGAVVSRPDFTVADFRELKFGHNVKQLPLADKKGNPLTPEEAYKYNRGNDGGKGANFEFWYSGSLSTLAEKRGLKGGATKALVESYASAFPVAVAWRAEKVLECQQTGFLRLPDGHRRVRFEATLEWQGVMANFFRGLADGYPPEERQAIEIFGQICFRKISTRAKNQIINALIQGTCATIIKRSILRIWERLHEFDCRFLMPIHDELVFSCNYNDILPFMEYAKGIMTDHRDIITSLEMNSTISIGATFEKFHQKKSPFGQMELSEAPVWNDGTESLPFIPKEEWGKEMSPATVKKAIEYLRDKR